MENEDDDNTSTDHDIKTENVYHDDEKPNPELFFKTEDGLLYINECNSPLILKTKDKSEHHTESNLKTEDKYQHHTESNLKTEDKSEHHTESNLKTEDKYQHHTESNLKTEDESKHHTESNLKTEDKYQHHTESNLNTEDKSEHHTESNLKTKDKSQHHSESNLKTEEEYGDPENRESFLKTANDSQGPSRSDTEIIVKSEDKFLKTQKSDVDNIVGAGKSDLASGMTNGVEVKAAIDHDPGVKVDAVEVEAAIDHDLGVKVDAVEVEVAIDHDPDAKVKSPGKAKKAKQLFECDVCERKVSRQWDLKIHKRIHSGERPYACSYCDQSFRSNSHRKRHEIIHTKDNKPFKCEQCIRSFHSRTELEEHDFSHTGISKHCCDQCGSYFSNGSALKTHISRVHDTLRSVPRDRASRISKDSSVLACEKCGQLFKKKKKYEDHCNFHCYYKALEAIREQKFGLKKEPT